MSAPVVHHADAHAEERQFDFGKNWNGFLKVLNDTRIQKAEESLKQMLKVPNLRDWTFLDIGSGSGLFSLERDFGCAQSILFSTVGFISL